MSYTSTTSATGHGEIQAHTNKEFGRQFKRKLARSTARGMSSVKYKWIVYLEGDGGFRRSAAVAVPYRP